MGGTKTPSRDEQAKDWTLALSLERSKRGRTGELRWGELALTHAGEGKKKKKKRPLGI